MIGWFETTQLAAVCVHYYDRLSSRRRIMPVLALASRHLQKLKRMRHYWVRLVAYDSANIIFLLEIADIPILKLWRVITYSGLDIKLVRFPWMMSMIMYRWR